MVTVITLTAVRYFQILIIDRMVLRHSLGRKIE